MNQTMAQNTATLTQLSTALNQLSITVNQHATAVNQLSADVDGFQATFLEHVDNLHRRILNAQLGSHANLHQITHNGAPPANHPVTKSQIINMQGQQLTAALQSFQLPVPHSIAARRTEPAGHLGFRL